MELRTIREKPGPQVCDFIKENAGRLGADLSRFRRKSERFATLETALIRNYKQKRDYPPRKEAGIIPRSIFEIAFARASHY
jgi:hypothetical protein